MISLLNGFNEEIESDRLILQDLESKLVTMSFEKGHILYQPGSRCNHMYFIITGLARACYFKNGKDVTCHFSHEGQAVTAIDSFYQRKKTTYQVEFLEDSTAMRMSFDDMEWLFDRHPKFAKLGREMMMSEYGNLVERLNDIQFHSAKERYDQFCTKNESLFQRVSLGQIASYLGITQETLSRIRAIQST